MQQLIVKVLFFLGYTGFIFSFSTLISRSGVVSHLYMYPILYVGYYAALFGMNKKYEVRKHLVLYSIPICLLSGIGLYINFQDLFPQIFPMITFVFAISLFSVLYNSKLLLGLIFFLLVLINLTLYPTYIAGKYITSINKPFLYADYEFLNTQGRPVRIEDKFILMDFMFLECKPCWQKIAYMKDANFKNLKIYIIINGKINSKDQFYSFFKDKNDFSYLYDRSGELSEKMGVKSFPTEYLIYNNTILFSDNGFIPNTKQQYIKYRQDLISNITDNRQ